MNKTDFRTVEHFKSKEIKYWYMIQHENVADTLSERSHWQRTTLYESIYMKYPKENNPYRYNIIIYSVVGGSEEIYFYLEWKTKENNPYDII